MTVCQRIAWILACGLALAAGAAQAHKASDAYLTLKVDGQRIEQRWDIALRDLDRDLALDGDADGQLSWGEVRQRWPQLHALAQSSLTLMADGQSCKPAPTPTEQLDEHSDGRYAVLLAVWTCPAAPRALTIDYRLFAASDADHRGLLRLQGDFAGQAVLTPGAEPHRLARDSALAKSDGQASSRSFSGFVAEGVRHIAVGLDHVLFLVTLLMVAVWRREGAGWLPRSEAGSAWKETLTLVTAFTVSHSLTLGLAASGVLAPPTRWVESLIALSVLVAALDNLRPFFPGPRWVMVSVFGLVHGFGFAGPLQDLGLRDGELALPLLGFNLGVELGQLAVVLVLLPLAIALRSAPSYRFAVVRGGSCLVALLALGWTLERSLELQILP